MMNKQASTHHLYRAIGNNGLHALYCSCGKPCEFLRAAVEEFSDDDVMYIPVSLRENVLPRERGAEEQWYPAT